MNFPMDQFGVVSPELKRIARTPLAAPATAPSESRDERVAQWLGADVKSVTTPGEVSATGVRTGTGRFDPSCAAGKRGRQSWSVRQRRRSQAQFHCRHALGRAECRLANRRLWRVSAHGVARAERVRDQPEAAEVNRYQSTMAICCVVAIGAIALAAEPSPGVVRESKAFAGSGLAVPSWRHSAAVISRRRGH